MTALMEFLKKASPWTRQETNTQADEGDGNAGRAMTGLYAQLTPEQRQKACNVSGPERSGRSDLPTVKHG